LRSCGYVWAGIYSHLFSPSPFQFDLFILLIALYYLLELIITKSFAMYSIFLSLCILPAAMAACPYMGSSHGSEEHSLVGAERVVPRDVPSTQSTQDFLDQFTLNDTNAILTSDVGGPIGDQFSLKAGERGPTLLEDFIFRQKIQHFDHERVSCRRLGKPISGIQAQFH
jgi:catalase